MTEDQLRDWVLMAVDLRRSVNEIGTAWPPLTPAARARRWVGSVATSTVPMLLCMVGAWGLGAEPLAAMRVAIGGWACVGLPLALGSLAGALFVRAKVTEFVSAVDRFADLVESTGRSP